jgi:hypothetical protein
MLTPSYNWNSLRTLRYIYIPILEIHFQDTLYRILYSSLFPLVIGKKEKIRG